MVPGDIDVTLPPEFMVATALSELLQVYPVEGVAVYVAAAPTQELLLPTETPIVGVT